MTIKEEIINLLLAQEQKHRNNPEMHDLVCDAIKEIRMIGCHTCIWYREGTCTRHFPGEERQPYYFCRDWEKESVWDK